MVNEMHPAMFSHRHKLTFEQKQQERHASPL